MNNKIIILCGFSASGKDSIARELEKQDYNFVVSTTTRPMRDGESENNPYHFVTNEEFLKLIEEDNLIEYRAYNTTVQGIPETWYYGVTKDAIEDDEDYVIVLDIVGLRGFKEQFPEAVTSFFIVCPDEERKQRCILRGDYDESEFERRLQDDTKMFPFSVILHEIDYVIDSTNIKDDVKEILRIMEDYIE